MALRPGTTVVLGAALAIGSMVAAYAVWAAGVHGGVAAAVYAVLALVGLVGAGMTLRDLTPRR